MSANKNIFLKWLEGKSIPNSELDHDLAQQNKLKFDNHADNADFKKFISKDRLESSFKSVIKASY